MQGPKIARYDEVSEEDIVGNNDFPFIKYRVFVKRNGKIALFNPDTERVSILSKERFDAGQFYLYDI